MKVYKFIPYDKKLVSRARELRKNQTRAEKKFWEILKSRKLAGYKFTRQKPLGNFIVDFYCAKLKLAIELDGEVHKAQVVRDKERDSLLKQKFGVRILRYNNQEVLNNPEKVLAEIIKYITHP